MCLGMDFIGLSDTQAEKDGILPCYCKANVQVQGPHQAATPINTQKRESEVKFLVMCGLYWNTVKDDSKVTGQQCGSFPLGASDGT